MSSYQQPPYMPGFVPPPPPGWGQPPFQQYGQAAPVPTPKPNGPPFKKQKGSHFVKNHHPPPPPPGWQPPLVATTYQAPVTGYESLAYATPAPGGYQYSQPPHHAQPLYQPTVPYAQPTYQTDPSQAFQQPLYHPDPNQAYQQSSYYVDPSEAYRQPPYQPLQSYQSIQPYIAPTVTPAPEPHSGYSNGNDAQQTSQPVSTALPPATLHQESTDEVVVSSRLFRTGTGQPPLDYCVMEFDFDGESTSLTDEIDPRFSLGLINWHPAVSTTTPLPSTFEEAEREAAAPVKVEKDEDESLSKYFTKSNIHELELSIRQTDDWEEVKNDPIFVKFVDTCEVVPLTSVIQNRDRPSPQAMNQELVDGDDTRMQTGDQQVTKLQPVQPTQAISQAQSNYDDDSDGDQAMEMSDDDDDEPEPVKSVPSVEATLESKKAVQFDAMPQAKAMHQTIIHKRADVVDSLERVFGSNEQHKLTTLSRPTHSARYSRSRSPEKLSRSRQASQQPRSRPTPHPRDAVQENVLAALGVEGSPKMVYPTPPPALAPTSPDRERSPDKFSRPTNGMYHPMGLPYGPHFPPPPPPREARSPSFDPWKAHDALHGNSRRTRSPSASSQHTAVGSDFEPQDLDITPKAKPPPPPPSRNRQKETDSGRKRNFDRMAEAEGDKRRRQPDDTPRARRKPNYDRTDAYSRRW